MGSFGDRLRREREMRGISLDEIATATKISTRNLRALEEEKFNQLPGGIFNKGFVRAYAKFLGIDGDQMVAEYVAASGETEAARDQKLQQDLSKVEFKRDTEDREISLEPKSQWGTIAVIVLLAVAAFGGYEVYQKKKAERHAQQMLLQQAQSAPSQQPASTPVQPPPTAAPADTPSPATTQTSGAPSSTVPTDPLKPIQSQTVPNPTSTSPKPADVARPASEKSPLAVTAKPDAKPTVESASTHPPTPIDVKIHADQQCWVSIIADGKTIMEGNLDAASEKAVRAKEKVVLVLGNAAGVEVSYNGKPLANLGNGQKVRKITFTPEGYE